MNIKEENIERHEIIIWEMIKSLSDVKECVENSKKNISKKELNDLKNKFTEYGEWIKKYTTE